MMKTRIIKTEDDYHSVLFEAEQLIDIDPELDTSEADRLELLSLLIEEYEKRKFPISDIDAVDAITYRMGEQGLRQMDLVPLLGSKSRVSEILGRKRPLTVQMIRSLSTGLGIPAELLISETKHKSNKDADSVIEDIDISKFPIKVMEKRGWFNDPAFSNIALKDKVKAYLSDIFNDNEPLTLYRRRFQGMEVDEKSYYSTLAWSARVLRSAKNNFTDLTTFKTDNINSEVLHDLCRLSWFHDGPVRAVKFLADIGIATVVEPRLPNSVIDGAAMLSKGNVPVIGITLRIDRVDYFWFTLLHEVAHVWMHLHDSDTTFIDRIDTIDGVNNKEKEANRTARDALIKRSLWERSPVKFLPSKQNIQDFADKLHVHPAIVAGRLHYETGHYERYREFIGQGTVRKLFSDILF